ncbi:AGE family epimerase/isomerase [Pontibacter sp. G13]|uniref:AGE family epimerase/isomerase n=1 Tax=Pontibacter sp. G13 TaxID=3074898 RepID=UPI00288C6258|nr:AGE family epimerase/isomerase [Pontibacter sp. G13]WNJ21573.1 AGE family epimerase/isomerase [Pontibacter sp. G13]
MNEFSWMQELRSCMDDEILPFWANQMKDGARGGFFGRADASGMVEPEAEKGGILHARLLWTWSAAARVTGNEAYRSLADHANHFLSHSVSDHTHGGVYWMLDAEGTPQDDRKHLYAQAFAIYAWAEYVRLTGDQDALGRAVDLTRQILKAAWHEDLGAFDEAFNREWILLPEQRLSPKDLDAPRSMNTHLHILEAFTNLLRVWEDEELRGVQRRLIRSFLDHIIDPETRHMRLFFDREWRPIAEEISYGHDVEASWLLFEAAEVLGDKSLIEEVGRVALQMMDMCIDRALLEDGGWVYEAGPAGLIDSRRYWWPQAEALVGLVNAWQLSGNARYLQDAQRTWRFVRKHLIEPRTGQWHDWITLEGEISQVELAGPWKGPYHNVRACLELIERMSLPVG